MNINGALSAIGSGDALKQAVGISLLSKVKDTESAQAATLLQDFSNAQKQMAASVAPYLGQTIDIRI
jgi:hypothetical protein